MINIVGLKQYSAPVHKPIKGSIMKSDSGTLFICVRDYQHGGLYAVSLWDGMAWRHPAAGLHNLDGLELITSGTVTLEIGDY